MNEQDTTLLEQRLGAALDAMTQREAPTAITVTELIASGRRRVRRRRTRATLGAGAAVLTTTALVLGVMAGAGHGGETTQAATGAPRPGASASGQNSQMQQQLAGPAADPVAPSVAFGWLPPDFSRDYEVSGGMPWAGSGVQVWGADRALLSADARAPGTGNWQVQTQIPAGVVQGHQAYWGAGAPGSAQAAHSGNLMLMWQYQPDSWVDLVLMNTPTSTANAQMLLNIAQYLQLGRATPAALPFHLPALPAGMHPDYALLDFPQQHGSHKGYVGLRFCITSPCSETGGLLISQQSTTWFSDSSLGIDSPPQLRRGQPLPEGGVPVTVGEYSAVLWTNAHGATLLFTYGTAQVIIQAAGKEYQSLGGLDGFLAFCRSLTWFGADPAQWTTDVVG